MDGVIIDSEKYWKQAELTLFGEWLPQWTKKDQQKIIGMNVNDTYRVLANTYGLSITREEYLRRINGVALEVYRNQCNLIEGFMELIKKLKQTDLKIALASSSLKEWIDIALSRFKLKPFFSIMISAEDIDGHSKPAPDIYLHTAKKLGVSPNECIVIEDSRHGVTSAKAAGMKVIGLRNGFNEAQDLSLADMEVMGYQDSQLKKLFE